MHSLIKTAQWREDAVTPIISTMLILVLMMTMITAILLWGAPTIHSMEVVSQHDATLGYFEVLNNDIISMLHDGANTTRTTDMTIPSGRLEVKNNDETWVVSWVEPTYTDEVYFYDFEQYSFGVNAPALTLIRVFVEWIRGEHSGSTYEYTGAPGIISVPYELAERVHITVRDPADDSVIANARVYSIGAIIYTMGTPVGTYHIRYANGGVSSDYPATLNIVDALLYIDNPEGRTVFLYIIQLSSAGISSTGAGDYNIHLELNSLSMNEFACIRNLRVQIFGDYGQAWYTEFTEKYRHYMGNPDLYIGFIPDEDLDCVFYQALNPDNPDQDNIVDLKLLQCTIEIDIKSR